jgi:hypothetical protein
MGLEKRGTVAVIILPFSSDSTSLLAMTSGFTLLSILGPMELKLALIFSCIHSATEMTLDASAGAAYVVQMIHQSYPLK